MTTPTPSTTPPVRLRRDGLEFTAVDGEVVVLDLKTSEYFSVNGTGADLWDALRAGTTEAELAALLEAKGAPAAAAAADSAAFVGQLRARGFLDDAADR